VNYLIIKLFCISVWSSRCNIKIQNRRIFGARSNRRQSGIE